MGIAFSCLPSCFETFLFLFFFSDSFHALRLFLVRLAERVRASFFELCFLGSGSIRGFFFSSSYFF